MEQKQNNCSDCKTKKCDYPSPVKNIGTCALRNQMLVTDQPNFGYQGLGSGLMGEHIVQNGKINSDYMFITSE